ncbi:unnamed protein product [Protopolystoma xenopodis]|uniref:Uncharacterized protein n=1 Tax=Protopolystoma xenopodis TaxID=117903 RepID=A0A3S4ZP82_9PLAT|nr:unnamed protein product [Protopolystoma xenopodis]
MCLSTSSQVDVPSLSAALVSDSLAGLQLTSLPTVSQHLNKLLLRLDFNHFYSLAGGILGSIHKTSTPLSEDL